MVDHRWPLRGAFTQTRVSAPLGWDAADVLASPQVAAALTQDRLRGVSSLCEVRIFSKDLRHKHRTLEGALAYDRKGNVVSWLAEGGMPSWVKDQNWEPLSVFVEARATPHFHLRIQHTDIWRCEAYDFSDIYHSPKLSDTLGRWREQLGDSMVAYVAACTEHGNGMIGKMRVHCSTGTTKFGAGAEKLGLPSWECATDGTATGG